MENCPICNTDITEKNIYDCGYSTFNVGHIECPNCGLKLIYNCVDSIEQYKKLWSNDVSFINKIKDMKQDILKKIVLMSFIKNKKNIYDLYEEIETETKIENNVEINNAKKILTENKIDFKISNEGELVFPSILKKYNYEDYIKSLNIYLPIKFI